MFDFRTVRSTLTNYAEAVKKLRLQIEALEQRREDILYAPPARTDVRAALAAWINRSTSEFEQHLVKGLHAVEKMAELNQAGGNGPAGDGTVRSVAQLFTFHVAHSSREVQNGGFDRAMCALLGPAILALVEKTLDGIDWPDTAVALSEREKMVAEIEEQLKKLRKEEDTLLAAGREAGLSVTVD